MTRKGALVTLGLLAAGVLLVVLSNLVAQTRPGGPGGLGGFPPLPALGGSDVGRYQAVKVADDHILIIDTTTGDLYRASMKDVKSYSERPKPTAGQGGGFPPLPKDKFELPKDIPLPKDLPPLPKDGPRSPQKDKEKPD
jgi:hypothetical protein